MHLLAKLPDAKAVEVSVGVEGIVTLIGNGNVLSKIVLVARTIAIGWHGTREYPVCSQASRGPATSRQTS